MSSLFQFTIESVCGRHAAQAYVHEVYPLLQCYHQYIPHGREQYEEINATNTREEVRSDTATGHGELVKLVSENLYTAVLLK